MPLMAAAKPKKRHIDLDLPYRVKRICWYAEAFFAAGSGLATLFPGDHSPGSSE